VSVQVTEAPNGLLTMSVSGTLKKAELDEAQALAVEAMRTHGKIRLLVITTNFLGWERGSNWDDVSFTAQHGRKIERIAIVGDRRWEDLALAFTGKGFRPTAVEYFTPGDLSKARTWVGAAGK
jgi:stage II sporulation SpoAA-like protein